MATDPARSILVVESEGGIRLSDVRKFLAEIEDAYNRILLFLNLIDSLRLSQLTARTLPLAARFVEYGPAALAFGGAVKPIHFTKSSVAAMVGKSQLLILKSVHLGSHGNWKLLGVSDSLEVLRKFLNDRHERRKDKDYREATDEERRHLENELLRTHVLAEKIKMARQLGATDEDLAPLLNELLYEPLDGLATFQDRGIIADVRVIGQDEPSLQAPDAINLNPTRKITLE